MTRSSAAHDLTYHADAEPGDPLELAKRFSAFSDSFQPARTSIRSAAAALRHCLEGETIHGLQQRTCHFRHQFGRAANSVELEVDCCTISRIRSIARTTACAPPACSSTADVISCVISLRRVVALAI